MLRSRSVILTAGLIAGALAMPAAAQVNPTACTTPLDPACNHLKCYQISDKPSIVVSKTPVLQLDNQFGREVVYRLQPVLLCVPTLKSCCNATGCSPANCNPNPVPSPGLPHLKCYKIKAKTCPTADCASLQTKFPNKQIHVNLRTQFGQEVNVPVGNPKLICVPADKVVVGQPTTTTQTTTTSTSTTTTTLPCHFDASSPTHCSGSCPSTTQQCVQTAPGKCDCLDHPVCCECGATGCTNLNGPCPAGCFGVAGASCNFSTRHCDCGYCRDAPSPSCTAIPCSASQPCPTGTICDPVTCPRPCDGPCTQPAGQCTPDQCFRNDGTVAVCRPTPFKPCDCCSPAGGPCTTDFDCCSGICNVGPNICQ